MALDASIPLQVKSFDPMEGLGKAMTLSSLGMQLQQAKKQQDTERTLGDLYKMAYDPATGQVDNSKVLGGLANSGLGHQIPVYQKQLAEANKSTAELGKINAEVDAKKFETAKGQLNLLNGTIASLLSKPDMNHQDVITAVSGLVQAGVIPESQAVAAVRQLPGDPGRLRQFVVSIGMQGMEASKRMEMMTPKFERIDTGGSVMTGTVNPMTGQFTPGGAFEKTVTPGENLSSATTRRGQDMTDTRERDFASSGVTYQQDADGHLIALPTKIRGGQQHDGAVPVTGTTVIGPSGQPVAGPGKALTEYQGKSTGFAMRAKESSRLIDEIGKGGEVQPGTIKRVAESTPLVGQGLGTMMNWTQSSEQQQVEQAQRDFVNAILRQESGAAINESEFNNAIRQYFPQPGDTKQVIDQKRANRETAIRALEIGAGPGIKQTGGAQSPTQRPQSIPQTNARGWQLHTDASGNRAYVSPDGSQYEEVR